MCNSKLISNLFSASRREHRKLKKKKLQSLTPQNENVVVFWESEEKWPKFGCLFCSHCVCCKSEHEKDFAQKKKMFNIHKLYAVEGGKTKKDEEEEKFLCQCLLLGSSDTLLTVSSFRGQS